MAGTSETLLEARIISTAFGSLSSGSAGGDRSGGTNRSSCVFVMGSVVAVRKVDPGQVAKRIKGAGARAGTELIAEDSGSCFSRS